MCSQQTKDSRILLGRKRWVFERDKTSTDVRRVTTCHNYCNMWGAVEQSINSGCQLRFVRWKKRMLTTRCWGRGRETCPTVPRVPRDATCLVLHCRYCSIWKWHFVAATTLLPLYLCQRSKDSVGTMGTIKVLRASACCLMLSLGFDYLVYLWLQMRGKIPNNPRPFKP